MTIVGELVISIFSDGNHFGLGVLNFFVFIGDGESGPSYNYILPAGLVQAF